MKGRIHSLETFGTVDGPGIRFVLFMQGCPLRCQYCHNPDTWDAGSGKLVGIEEVLAEIEPFLEYYRMSGGGITVTGGEPLLQAPFVAELFTACKARWGLHTALDTSGFCEPEHVRDLIEATDLVLLDLKLMDPDKHAALTGQSNGRILRLAEWLSARKKKMWIRRVLVPGVTDDPDDLTALGRFVKKLGVVENIEVLPYHRMGGYKWKQLGIPYPLNAAREPTEHEVDQAYRFIERGRKSATIV